MGTLLFNKLILKRGALGRTTQSAACLETPLSFGAKYELLLIYQTCPSDFLSCHSSLKLVQVLCSPQPLSAAQVTAQGFDYLAQWTC